MLGERCDRLRSLHVRDRPLVLPNAWDAASARAVVAAGFPVVATTSGGVAATLGFDDHERAPADEMFAAAARIAHAVDVPVTIDAEAGYGKTPNDLVEALLDVGAAGCNLEDTDHRGRRLVDPAEHAAWLAAVRETANARDYGLVLNARIDVFIGERESRSQLKRMDEAIARARTYVEAGADCVYPIFLSEREAIARFVDAVDAPVNILAVPPAPPAAELAALGVARVSYGSSLHTRSIDQLATLLQDEIRSKIGR